MLNYAMEPIKYDDQNDAIYVRLQNFIKAGGVIDLKANPNGQYSLLLWAHDEIIRLRKKCNEVSQSKSSQGEDCDKLW